MKDTDCVQRTGIDFFTGVFSGLMRNAILINIILRILNVAIIVEKVALKFGLVKLLCEKILIKKVPEKKIISATTIQKLLVE